MHARVYTHTMPPQHTHTHRGKYEDRKDEIEVTDKKVPFFILLNTAVLP